MKLAEALAERKAAQTKISEINTRLQRIAIVQEGELAAEDPATLLIELEEVTKRLEILINAINNTNIVSKLSNGQTITSAIAQRDVLRMKTGVIDSLINTLGNTYHFRTRGSEIKFIPTVNVNDLQKQKDILAKQYREIDTAIQSANWSFDLVE